MNIYTVIPYHEVCRTGFIVTRPIYTLCSCYLIDLHTVVSMVRARNQQQQQHFSGPPSLQTSTFAEITSAHGFAFFRASSGWPSKAAWAVITLAAAFSSIYFTSKICLNSLQPPFFLTEISIQSVKNGSLVPFPDIVLCDPSPWDLDKAAKLNISRAMISYLSYFLFPVIAGLNQSTVDQKVKEQDAQYREILKQFDNNPLYLLDNVTKDCGQLVRTCQLGSSDLLKGRECCAKIFSNVEYTQLYKCFSSGIVGHS